MRSIGILSKKLVLSLLIIIVLLSCASKEIKRSKIYSNDKVLWQYLNYLNSDYSYNGNHDIKRVSDFFILYLHGSLTFPLIAHPIVGKDYIIAMDKYGVVSRINSLSRNVEWKNSLLSKKLNFFKEYANGGLSQYKNKIYVTYGTNFINCLNSKTGELLWTRNLREVVRAYPIFYDNAIFLQTLNNGVYAINSETGEILWYKAGLDDGVSVLNVISPVVYKDLLIIQDSVGNITAINRKMGLEEWSLDNNDIFAFNVEFSAENTLIYQPIIMGDYLYFYFANGYFFKLNLLNNEVIWKEKLNINKPFYILYNIIFAINEDNTLVAIDANNGKELWRAKLIDYLDGKAKRKNRYWNSPVLINDLVCILSSKGELLSFDFKNGKIAKVDYNMGDNSYLAPTNMGKKVLIISSK